MELARPRRNLFRARTRIVTDGYGRIIGEADIILEWSRKAAGVRVRRLSAPLPESAWVKPHRRRFFASALGRCAEPPLTGKIAGL